MKPLFTAVLLLFVISTVVSCKKDESDNQSGNTGGSCTLPAISASSTVTGFGILDKLPGIWNGPVNSSTALGSFPEWIVDFRPNSASQVSAKNELDSLNDIFMSFFVVKHDCEYKMAMRNGGGFAGMVRNAYMVIDSVNEGATESFYRFSDPVAGTDRVYMEVTFRSDSLIMHTYTNVYNTLSPPVSHFIWRADLRDSTSKAAAVAHFGFPQKQMQRDFSSTFNGLTEAVFYSAGADPYPESEQPYLGTTNMNVTISNPPAPDPAKKVLIIVTTQPLFSGFTFIPGNLDYRSRYVFVGAGASTGYNFNYMHPGDYYVNAIYDSNGDSNFSSGDYINQPFDVPFTLTESDSIGVNVDINFLIP